MNSGTASYDPGRVASPIQLLAALLLAMTTVVASLLAAAGFIREPPIVLEALVAAAIVFVPFFVAVLFIALTRFRPFLLGDETYLGYLRWLALVEEKKSVASEQAGDDDGVVLEQRAVNASSTAEFSRDLAELHQAWTEQANKQGVLNEIARLLGREPWMVSVGSTEPKRAFIDIAETLHLGLDTSMPKQELAKAIALAGRQK